MTIEKGHTMKIRQRVIRLLCLFGLWLGLGLQAHAQTDTVTYVYTDPQGTPLVKADAQGNVIARYDYTPYGNAVTSLGSPPNGSGYTGHVNDPETGLVYMQQRYYDPAVGRFLSRDPLSPVVGNLYNFNRYGYANNNPIVNVDPDGRSVTCGQDSCTIEAHSVLEFVLDYAFVQGLKAQRVIQNQMTHHSAPLTQQNESHEGSPPLPGGLVGVQDGKSGVRGRRTNSGPLAPEHGGTGDAEKDFDKLTGGKSTPTGGDGVADGSGGLVGENGIRYRPAVGSNGPRIDIPANGDKSHETLHYPSPPPPPPPPPKPNSSE
jgi:RHS repeat-associated protein